MCKVFGEPGHYDWNEKDEENTSLVQSDYDFPGLASTFGLVIDDTLPMGEQIEHAQEYLDGCAVSGAVVDDPGYFQED